MARESILFLRWLGVLSALLALSACDSGAPPQPGPQYATSANGGDVTLYRLAIHPLYNPKKLMLTYQPLIDYLNNRF